jgi:ankyrin repeat protein
LRLTRFLQLGATVHSPRPSTSWQPLHLAAGKGKDTVVQLLLQASAKVDARGTDGDTPLMHAASGGHHQTCELLLSHSAQIAATNRFRATCLHFAAGNGRDECVTLLLARGARAAARDVAGDVPSDWARKKGHTKAAALLEPMLRKQSTLRPLSALLRLRPWST